MKWAQRTNFILWQLLFDSRPRIAIVNTANEQLEPQKYTATNPIQKKGRRKLNRIHSLTFCEFFYTHTHLCPLFLSTLFSWFHIVYTNWLKESATVGWYCTSIHISSCFKYCKVLEELICGVNFWFSKSICYGFFILIHFEFERNHMDLEMRFSLLPIQHHSWERITELYHAKKKVDSKFLRKNLVTDWSIAIHFRWQIDSRYCINIRISFKSHEFAYESINTVIRIIFST